MPLPVSVLAGARWPVQPKAKAVGGLLARSGAAGDVPRVAGALPAWDADRLDLAKMAILMEWQEEPSQGHAGLPGARVRASAGLAGPVAALAEELEL